MLVDAALAWGTGTNESGVAVGGVGIGGRERRRDRTGSGVGRWRGRRPRDAQESGPVFGRGGSETGVTASYIAMRREVSGEACGISGRRELEEVARLAHVVR